jgi:hypothetical protein
MSRMGTNGTNDCDINGLFDKLAMIGIIRGCSLIIVFISRHSGESRNPVLEMVPDFRLDDVWMPDQVRHDGKAYL